MNRNGHLREELKVLQMEKKHFLYVESRLEKVDSVHISQFLDLYFAVATSKM